MAKLIVTTLKAGQSKTGMLVGLDKSVIKLSDKNGETTFRISSVPEEVTEAIADVVEIEDVISVSVDENGDYFVNNYGETWPEEK